MYIKFFVGGNGGADTFLENAAVSHLRQINSIEKAVDAWLLLCEKARMELVTDSQCRLDFVHLDVPPRWYACTVPINSKKKRVMLCNLFVANSIPENKKTPPVLARVAIREWQIH